jgi:DNA-binding SARP family transcriptional activator
VDQFGVLGPLEVRRDGVVIPVNAAKHRVVLAALLLNANRSVPTSELIRWVWGEVTPDRAAQTLPVYVMRLRRQLGDPQLIHTTPTGYRIDIAEDALDLHRFRQFAERGAAHVAAERYEQACQVFEQALACWRGPALADVGSDALQEAEVPHLTEQRLRVTSDLVDAKLRLGRWDEVVADLRRLTAQHPLREQFWAHLMVALYRSDRQADALDAYRQASAALARDLGVDPSENLRDLHRAVLTGDPSLGAGTAAPPPPHVWTPVSQLPAPVANFIGRTAELTRVTGLLTRSASTVVVSGPPGVGKTAFATAVGHAMRERYPDGQLYVNLRGYSTAPPLTTQAVLARFLRALGVRADRIPVDEAELVESYRALLRGRRVLITLDNAASAEQVRPLLAGEPGCSTLITSRNELCELPRAARVRLDVLRTDEAWKLLARSLGADAAVAQFEAIGELARLCGYLPLALRIALGNLVGTPHGDIASYVDELRAGDRLSALAVDNDDEAAVRRAFDLSYTALGADAAELFGLLGLVPGQDFSAHGAAALLGVDVAKAEPLVQELAAANLVQRLGNDRFSLHDLLRDYAEDRNRRSGVDPAEASGRLFAWYLRSAHEVAALLYPELNSPRMDPPHLLADEQAAIEWLGTERPNLLAAAEHCARRGPRPMAWQLIDAVGGYLGSHGHHVEFLSAVDAALHAAGLEGDRNAEVAMLVWLACEHRNLGNLRVALEYLNKAGDHAGPAGWLLEGLRGVVNVELSHFPAAVEAFDRVLDLGRGQAALPHMRITALAGLGAVNLMKGNVETATEQLGAALALAHDAEGVNIEATCLSLLARCHLARGDVGRALALLHQSVALWLRTGSRHQQVEALAHLANALCRSGDHQRAFATAQQALATVQELGSSSRIESEVHNALGQVLRATHQPGRAIGAHRRALELATASEFRYGAVRAHLGLIEAHLDAGERSDALRHARTALEISRDAGFGLFEVEARKMVARLLVTQLTSQ